MQIAVSETFLGHGQQLLRQGFNPLDNSLALKRGFESWRQLVGERRRLGAGAFKLTK